jgi:hypothetical protein
MRKKRITVPEKRDNEKIVIKLDLEPNQPHYEMFKHIMRIRGATINNEIVRILIKEEYDRLHKVPFHIDDPLVQEAEKFIKEHPELGFKDVEDFLRSAARLEMISASKQR